MNKEIIEEDWSEGKLAKQGAQGARRVIQSPAMFLR